jgi:hypothetical protein
MSACGSACPGCGISARLREPASAMILPMRIKHAAQSVSSNARWLLDALAANTQTTITLYDAKKT